MTVYLNMQTAKGRETVDSFTKGSDDAPAKSSDFRRYVSQMIDEYRLAGMNVYKSSRPCANWLD